MGDRSKSRSPSKGTLEPRPPSGSSSSGGGGRAPSADATARKNSGARLSPLKPGASTSQRNLSQSFSSISGSKEQLSQQSRKASAVGRSSTALPGAGGSGGSKDTLLPPLAPTGSTLLSHGALPEVEEAPQASFADRLRDVVQVLGGKMDSLDGRNADLVANFAEEASSELRELFVLSKGEFADSLDSPAAAKSRLSYLLRSNDGAEGAEESTPSAASFQSEVVYGTIENASFDSLLALLEGVYKPLLCSNKHWPRAMREEFNGRLMHLLAVVAGTASGIKGHTVLYVPSEELYTMAEGSGQQEQQQPTEDSLKNLQQILVHWCTVISALVEDVDQAGSAEQLGPLEEIEMCRNRYNDLSSVLEQTKRPEHKILIKHMADFKSPYINNYNNLMKSLEQAVLQTRDNLKFLSMLAEPCRELSTASAEALSAVFTRLFMTTRIIWSHSQYFKSEERICSLLRKTTNVVIGRCQQQVSLKEIFEGDVYGSITVLRSNIAIGRAWKQAFRQQCAQIERYGSNGLKWDFAESNIFAQLDAFLQRCGDLIEVCEGQIQFARKLPNGARAPIPLFGGTQGPETSGLLRENELAFERLVEKLWAFKQSILDVKQGSWHDEFSSFKKGLKDLELMFISLMQSAFDRVSNIPESVELLQVFRALAKRHGIVHVLERKASDIWAAYNKELRLVQTDFDSHKRSPEILRFHPDYSGAAHWAKFLHRRLSLSWLCITKSPEMLEIQNLYEYNKTQSELLLQAMEEYAARCFNDWVASVPQGLGARLLKPLMARRPDGTIEICFDQDILKLFTETHYWRKMGYDIPFHLQEVCAKKEELRVLRENVLLVVRDYNDVLANLTANEQVMFREKIRALDRKVNPGLTNLTWGSKGITDFFVKECRKYAHDVGRVVLRFVECKEKLRRLCVAVSELVLSHVEAKRLYTVEEFWAAAQAHAGAARGHLATLCGEISAILTEVYGFLQKTDNREILAQWHAFVRNVDAQILLALRQSVKRSLLELTKVINGDHKLSDKEKISDVQPLFKVEFVWEASKIEFSPSMEKVEETVIRVAREVLATIKTVARFEDAHVPSQAAGGRGFEELAGEEEVLKIIVHLQSGLGANAAKCGTQIHIWDTYRDLWEQNKDAYMRRFAKQNRGASDFDHEINHYVEQANNLQKEETYTNINFVRLDSSPLKQALVGHCVSWQNRFTTLLKSLSVAKLNDIYTMIRERSAKLSAKPRNLDELTQFSALLEASLAEREGQEAAFVPLREGFEVLKKYEVGIDAEDMVAMASLNTEWEKHIALLQESERQLSEYRGTFKEEVLGALEEFQVHARICREDFLNRGPFDAREGNLSPAQALEIITGFKHNLQDIAAKERSLSQGLNIFAIPQVPSQEMEATAVEIEALVQVWELAQQWQESQARWMKQTFQTFQLAAVKDEIAALAKKLSRLPMLAGGWKVLVDLKAQLSLFSAQVPLIEHLMSANMRERHWEQLQTIVGRPLHPEAAGFSIADLTTANIEQFAENIEEIFGSATREVSLETSLAGIKETWEKLNLEVVPHKTMVGHFRFGSVQRLFDAIEDHQIALAAMKTLPHFRAFERQIEKWEAFFSLLTEVLESLGMVQKQWSFLENIFIDSEDIRRQLPKESAIFDLVHASWIELMQDFDRVKNAKTIIETKPALLAMLREFNVSLEKVQKSLEMYLETKRQSFPRFYFLSNDDLLEVLGQAKDARCIQPHLKKCFEGLYRLDFLDNARKVPEVAGLFGVDGEQIPFYMNVTTEGPIESWLSNVERVMRKSLQQLLVECYGALTKKQKREKWVTEWPGQLLIVASQLAWTADVSRALQTTASGATTAAAAPAVAGAAPANEVKEALKEVLKRQLGLLKKLSEIIKTVSPIERNKLISLITIEVHHRDVLEKLYRHADNELGVTSFEWVSQLRAVMDKQSEDCVIKQNNAVFRYGYEYLGNSGRLVVTPLTERCYMTLTTAIHMNRGGNLQGPAGTGKTETVKDLGKALGKFVIIVNCSDSIDYKSMGRLLSGLAQTGCWGCFDEFNRIELEVLSVVTLQISSILNACAVQKASRKPTFFFEGQEIRLDASCGVFITLNPGSAYVGRVELPDALKRLFRPVSMMVPDSSQIAEIMLFAEGFENTRVLARKIDSLYRLSAQQLSHKDHYDFGLRAMTSAVKFAGLKKREDPSVTSEQIAYSALYNCNAPKLSADDLKIFSGLLGDLFPAQELLSAGKAIGLLRTAVDAEFARLRLQPSEAQAQKVLQLFETKTIRHAVMLVGKSGSGKSTCWTVLQAAMNAVAAADGHQMFPVEVLPINPKSMSLSDFYGQLDFNNSEWKDGVFASLLRSAAAEYRQALKWLLFDGPVDTLWVESMNSLMDDNKVLTLNSGERITMPPFVSLLFEVEDLAAASPATVSRCGMVYFDEIDWQTLVHKWVSRSTNSNTSGSGSNSSKGLAALCKKYLPRMIECRRTKCVEVYHMSDLALVHTLSSFYDSIAAEHMGGGAHFEDEAEALRVAELWFVFCVTWSVGAGLDEESKRVFDMTLRELEGTFPSKDTVYDYVVTQSKKAWVHWDERAPKDYRYNLAQFGRSPVPVKESLQAEFLLGTLIRRQIPFLVCGESGVGKTMLVREALSAHTEQVRSVTLSLAGNTSPGLLQTVLEANLDKRTKSLYVPQGNKPLYFFIDDLGAPERETYGAKPPLEFLRQLMDYGFIYDREKLFTKTVQNVSICGAITLPRNGRSGGSQKIENRFVHLHLDMPSEASLNRIYSTILGAKLQEFDESIKAITPSIARFAIELLAQTSGQLLPTPTKIHYSFGLKEVSRVCQGVLRANKAFFDTRDSIVKLVLHETARVFGDRLVNDEDTDWFLRAVDEKAMTHFSTSMRQLFPTKQNRRVTLFGDFVSNAGKYEELADEENLRQFLDAKVTAYNGRPGVVPLDIVLFHDAIEHLCRILRVVQMEGLHLMLAGIGGSGRRSLTKLAAFVSNVPLIELRNGLCGVEETDTLKECILRAGAGSKRPVILLVTDHAELDLQKLNSLLSLGEIPTLLTKEELGGAFEAIKLPQHAAGGEQQERDSFAAKQAVFVQHVRENVKVVLSINPFDASFGHRLRQFPALLKHVEVDWYSQDWPHDALAEVAGKYLSGMETRADLDLVGAAVKMHASVQGQADKVLAELKRHINVTPSHFLEFLKRFTTLCREKRETLGLEIQKLKNGLNKLVETRKNVQDMSVELEQSKRDIAVYKKECEEFLQVIISRKREADDQAKEVAAHSERLGAEEEQVKIVAQNAQDDLAEAMPALEDAMKALEGLSKKDIQEIKSYAKPPPLVEKVLEAVMVLKKTEALSWEEAKRQLNNPLFIKSLVTFDKDNISDKVLRKIQTYSEDESFVPETVGKVSGAAKSLCMWVCAMERYAVVYRQIAPKRETLRSANEALAAKQASLKDARDKLAAIKAIIDDLQHQYDEKLLLQAKLKADAELNSTKLQRAEQLVSGLAGERQRWETTVKDLEASMQTVVGRSLLAAAFLAYSGPFPSAQRALLLRSWEETLRASGEQQQQQEDPTSFDPVAFLGNASVLRDWRVHGLPSDETSAENGIIIVESARLKWPIIVDPQNQANQWLKRLEGDAGLKILDANQPDLARALEIAIKTGASTLLQGLGETIPPLLVPVIDRAVVTKNGRSYIFLNGKEVDYSPRFRLYMTTRLGNPHFPPEIAAKATVVNFAVKEEGLQTQLLGMVVKEERPSLETEKQRLVMEIAESKTKLSELEDTILHLLSSAQGSLLDDAKLVDTLSNSKLTAETISVSLVESEVTAKEIDAARNEYRSCAALASGLYFVINGLGTIDPMYQFSLETYVGLFEGSIRAADRSAHLTLAQRIVNINAVHLSNTYTNISRGLFQRDRLLFSLQIALKISEAQGGVSAEEIEFLTRERPAPVSGTATAGGARSAATSASAAGKSVQTLGNGGPQWLSPSALVSLRALAEIPGLGGLLERAQSAEFGESWRQWYTAPEPELLAVPGSPELSGFKRLLVVKALRIDRLKSAVAQYIGSILSAHGGSGSGSTGNSSSELESALLESRCETPVMLILSPGSDPTNAVKALAKEKGFLDKFFHISLGQGQAAKAARIIEEGAKVGNWVYLANCHLSVSWLGALESIVDGLQKQRGAVHADFRLWISSSPHDKFPLSILQRSVKVAVEPPTGFRAIIKNLSALGGPSATAAGAALPAKKAHVYRRLRTALAFFHALLLERKKFGSLGWNNVYDFNDSDFENCDLLLRKTLEDNDAVPWQALRYLIADANYGGRVTDEWDRRLLHVYIEQLFTEDSVRGESLPLALPQSAATERYRISDDAGLEELCALLPDSDPPEIFGQTSNAQIASQAIESELLIQTLASIMPATGGGAVSLAPRAAAPGEGGRAIALAAKIAADFPEMLDVEYACKIFDTKLDPVNVVLVQEMARYNGLVNELKRSMSLLERALKGHVAMDKGLQELHASICKGRVPAQWSGLYPSQQSLDGWVTDLRRRFEYFGEWSRGNEPEEYWLGGFTLSGVYAFLTAVQQKAARQQSIAIDNLQWEFSVPESGKAHEGAAGGGGGSSSSGAILVCGVRLEGADWNAGAACLVEARPMQAQAQMPVIQMVPVENKRRSSHKTHYTSPVYYSTVRAGTREKPSFVVAAELKAGEHDRNHWLKRGVALTLV